MEDKFYLNRFVEAQTNTYKIALFEIKKEKKSSHWMWYIFPQYHGLGRSNISVKYAINSKDEAKTYLNHPILGARLKEITETFFSIENKSAYDILGGPDDMKIKSSMTLFDSIQDETDLFDAVLKKYFNGDRCKKTLQKINNE
jgi:uncharacterized protein (DUF1810 family)